MNGLIMRDFHRERFSDPTGLLQRSDTHSPKATEFVEALRNKSAEFSVRNSDSLSQNSSHHITKDSLKHLEHNRSPDNHSDDALNTSADNTTHNNKDIDKDIVLDKSVDEETFNGKYNRENSNSSDLDSDVDKDELIPNSPRSEYPSRSEFTSRNSVDYYQHLPSNLPYRSDFSSEEANLRARLKDFGSPPFGDDEYHRKFAFPDGKTSHLVHPDSSPTRSPQCKTLQRSPISPYRRLPRSADELDETLTPNIREGLYFCHLCSFSGTTQAAFDQHMTVHFEHVCPHCDYKSRTEGRLKRHIKDFHTEDPDGGYGSRTMPGRPKVFRCKQCEFSTTDKIEFWSHSRTHIKEDKLLQCPRCPFVTEYKHHLEYHLRNHFGSKPFKCPKCNYACVNKSMLNSHMKSHTNVYQYRCADCTYATKYCHSLKLHLRKYNHKPAAVLNSDGSLPQGVDATASGLSLLSKRGPPRGPRGPRKDKMDVGPPVAPHFPIAPSPMGPMPGLPSMISPFWPILPGQLPGSLPSPLGLAARFPSHLAGLPGLPNIKKEELTSPVPISSADINPFKCNYCSFVGTSREVLTSHVMKVHGSDNQDLFSLFGIHSESLLNEKTRMNAINSLTSPLKSPRMNFFPPGFSPSHGIKREHPDNQSAISHDKLSHKDNILSPYSFMNGKYPSHDTGKDEGIDILKQMTLKFGSGPIESPKKPKVQTPQGDVPLDLTKPRNSQSPLSPGAQSPHENKLEDGNQSSGENSVYSNEMASPTPRKRSRKGKAFKLDTLCMKLQEQQRTAMESDEESIELEDYPKSRLKSFDHESLDKEHREADLSPDSADDVDEQKIMLETYNGNNTEDVSKVNDTADDDDDAELEDDFKKIHSSLDMLNQNGNHARSDDESHRKTDGGPKREEMGSASVNGNHNRRKNVPTAIQRGADLSWKMFNDPKIVLNITKSETENPDDVKEDICVTEDDNDDIDQTDADPKSDEYECPHCKISFFDCIMYTMHMGYHGYKDPFTCNMCGDICKDRVQFNLHIARAAHN